MNAVTGAGGNATFTYNAQGRVQTLGLPNQVSRSFGYDSAGRVVGGWPDSVNQPGG